eukprot:1860581-Amphidinium_carterae.1
MRCHSDGWEGPGSTQLVLLVESPGATFKCFPCQASGSLARHSGPHCVVGVNWQSFRNNKHRLAMAQQKRIIVIMFVEVIPSKFPQPPKW